MRLSHVVLAVATLLPLSSQAITLDKLGGRWVDTDVTCKPDLNAGEFCEFIIKPVNKSIGEFYIAYKGKAVGKAASLAVTDEDVWTVSIDGVPYWDMEYEDGMLYDEDGNKYHRVSK